MRPFSDTGYYPVIQAISPYNIEQEMALDRSAFGSTHCMLASDWAEAFGNA